MTQELHNRGLLGQPSTVANISSSVSNCWKLMPALSAAPAAPAAPAVRGNHGQRSGMHAMSSRCRHPLNRRKLAPGNFALQLGSISYKDFDFLTAYGCECVSHAGRAMLGMLWEGKGLQHNEQLPCAAKSIGACLRCHPACNRLATLTAAAAAAWLPCRPCLQGGPEHA